MKPIFYKSKENGKMYKVVIMTKEHKRIDQLLDVMNKDSVEFIEEEEFEHAYNKKMSLPILDEDDFEVIGELTMENMEIEPENAF